MKKIILLIGCILTFIGCEKNDIPYIAPKVKLNTYNLNTTPCFFYGYLLNDPTGFERHDSIDSFKYIDKDSLRITENLAIKIDSSVITVWVGNQESVDLWKEIYKQGSSIVVNSIKQEKDSWLTGIKNNKIWIGQFDTITKKQKDEWINPIAMVRDTNIHMGYGEYESVHIQNFKIDKLLKVADNYIVSLGVKNEKLSFNIGSYFLVDKRVISIPLEYEKGEAASFVNWFDNTMLIGQGDSVYTIMSNDGELIEPNISFPKPIPSNNITALTSHDWIDYNGTTIKRQGFDSTSIVWSAQIERLKEIPTNARVVKHFTYTDSIAEYKVDATLYNGSKLTFNFNVNIESGEVEDLNIIEEEEETPEEIETP